MNKAICKRMIGLLIIVFAFMTFAPKNVFAEGENKADSKECKEARKTLEQKGAAKYGIVTSYDQNSRTFTLSMSKDSRDNKFLEAAKLTNPVFDITSIQIQGAGGTIENESTKSNYITKFRTLQTGQTITISADNLRLLAQQVTTEDNPTIKVIFTLKPHGFEDPDLKKACGENTDFEYKVSVSYEYHAVLAPEVYGYDYPDTSTIEYDEYSMSINCDRNTYMDGSTERAIKDGSFERAYCDEYKKAKASGVKPTQFGSKGGDSHQVYKDVIKDGPTSFKCNYKIDRTNPSIWLLDSNGNVVFDENGERKPNPNYYANTSYLIGEGKFEISKGTYTYHTEIGSWFTEEAKCEVKCDEVVTVEYGQPVASHGGMCFEYKVRVTSRVNCGYNKNKITTPKKGIVCPPTPECVDKDDSTVTRSQGGPSDEFDECVQKCDGGRYSDRCSNKCYKQVYGTTKLISQVSGYELGYATKVARYDCTSGNGYKDASNCRCIYGAASWTTNGGDRVVNDVVSNCDSPRHGYLAGNTGYEIYKSGIPARKTCTDSCHWLENTNSACQNRCSGNYNDSDSTFAIDDDYGDDSPRNPKTGENLRKKLEELQKNASYSTTCNAVYANSQGTYSMYHKTINADGTKTTYGNAKAWITLDRDANDKVYKELQTACQAAAKCNTTTAEFTISASYTDTDNKTEVINYPYEDKKDSIKFSQETNATTCSKTDAISKGFFTTILENDGCYNCAKGCDATNSNPSKDCRKWYRTEWSFPGVWFSDKHNDLVFHYEDTEDSSYSQWAYKFCLPWNTADVNEKWYNYYHKIAGDKLQTSKKYDEETRKTCKDGTKLTCDTKTYYNNATFTDADVNSLKYNINAATRNFGFYEWDIDINCFYAQNTKYQKESCTCPTKGSYDVETRDLENLFPDTEGNALTSPEKTGRTPGFNWTEAATQEKKDENYKSYPAQYATWVQKKGYAVYSDDYLDYEIYLSKDKINEIRKQDVKYNEFGGKFNTPGKIEEKSASTYQSKLIREILVNDAIYPSYSALQCNNIGPHNKVANYQAECADFSGEVK